MMDWSLISDDSIMKENNSQNETEVSDLDLIPTKICSINPDPVLMVTPEKPSMFRSKQQRIIKPSPLVEPRPNKARVRFDLPDSVTSEEISDQNTTESSGKNSTSSSNYTDGDSTNNNNDDFATKAALFTQRNPLGDITTGSFQNLDFSSSTEGMSSLSNVSDQLKFSKIFDMGGKMLKINAGKQTSPLAIQKTKLPNHRKQTAVQTKIDKLTDAIDSNLNISPKGSPSQSLVEQKPKEKQMYLKKRSGLQRHDHTLKFTVNTVDELAPTKLEKPKYQSSLVAGQKLQSIQNEEFNALKAVSGKLKTDEKLQKHVDSQAAIGTNIDPEEKLFNNLVCVEVPFDDVIAASEIKRIKRPAYTKVNLCEEPNIMDMYPDNLITEKIVLDSKCFSLPSLTAQVSTLDSMMSLYEHSLHWEHFNSY